jgi:hypothetical protein
MAGQQQMDEHTHTQETTGKALKRRGILAAGAAVVAGIVAKQTAQSVAANTDGQALLIAGSNSESTAGTSLTWTGGTISSGAALSVGDGGNAQPFTAMVAGVATGGKAAFGVYGEARTGGTGVYGKAINGFGVQALGSTGVAATGGFVGVQGTGPTGIFGTGTSVGAVGVQGLIPNTSTDPNTFAVQGFNHSTGAGGVGVQGQITSNAANTIAVYGSNQSSGAGGVGVRGDCAAGIGVLGQSTNGTGVIGSTVNGLYGIIGNSGSSSGSAGLLGVANGPNAIGFGTIAQGGATFAGYFNGTTVVNGAFAVTGAKSAAVKDAAGEYRLMYSVESPEAWFEDFGTGTLVNGKAEVKIDPLFAHHIRTDQYHVFLTPHDAEHHLAATARTVQSFSVEADTALAKLKGKSAADVNGTFSYRIVAKRNDIAGERLAKFTMPPPLVAPEVPKPAPEPIGKKP